MPAAYDLHASRVPGHNHAGQRKAIHQHAFRRILQTSRDPAELLDPVLAAGEWFGGTPEPFTPQAIADQPCHGTELERRFERLFDDVLHEPSCDDRKNPYGTMLWQDDQVEDPLYHRHRIDPQHG
uniref:(northern house mosquito) hypothetical protein n=1 Tax=Culex pipiens TaxID=7175 RepID=A0A8D8AF55_CULPI